MTFQGLLLHEALGSSRIKDIVYFEGVRDNILVGYGLVVGLNGSGDNLRNSTFTEKGLIEFLEKLGINSRSANLKTKNVAAVMVTATLPPFARSGSYIPINVSTLGDAKSLKGGNLLATPLLGADGAVYAVAQGPVSVGSSQEASDGRIKTTPTAGYVLNGGIVEKEIDFVMNEMQEVKLALKNPDLTTARAIKAAINGSLGSDGVAEATDPGTVTITIPKNYKNGVVSLLADIENLTIIPDNVAKIIIDSATDTVVISDNVKISKVAIAQGNLIVKVSDEEKISNEFISEQKKQKDPQEPGTRLALLEESADLNDLIQGLNSLGVKTQDLISILKSIQQAGALQAVIEVK